MILMAEVLAPGPGLAQAVAATMQAATKLRGSVEFMAKGALPNDGKTIADERPAPLSHRFRALFAKNRQPLFRERALAKRQTRESARITPRSSARPFNRPM